ncbi:actin-related protein ARPC5 [Schizopora paradoxa]|uniref:Actin-related protein 2/3 complex subunit 5 n=1 Tax=Schizopora paradoxa TaxID=27342 RepID=A0A0H2S3S0_9AGAM|nr:actin-related protein ARPC5 [Schizopora paradoxa]
METSFRKIDIDAYDEDVIQEEELYDADPRDPAQVLNDTKQKTSAVRGYLSKGDTAGALTMILTDPPYGPNVEQAKETNLSTLLTILGSTKSSEVSSVVKGLSQDAQDTLMKYLYKGMATSARSDANTSVLLSWHEKLTEVAGIGCIVRVMTDRRLV